MQSLSEEVGSAVMYTVGSDVVWYDVCDAVWSTVGSTVRHNVWSAVSSAVWSVTRKEVRNAMVEKGDLTQYRGCRKAICDCVRDVRSERCCLGWRD